MFYRKNLPGWERTVRAVGGIVMIAYGLLGMPGLLSMPGTTAGYLIAGTGAIAILTGFFGFCPMCAMVGRRLPSQ
jgi:Inner membrane protein YgaP-like, transmembrane domain